MDIWEYKNKVDIFICSFLVKHVKELRKWTDFVDSKLNEYINWTIGGAHKSL